MSAVLLAACQAQDPATPPPAEEAGVPAATESAAAPDESASAESEVGIETPVSDAPDAAEVAALPPAAPPEPVVDDDPARLIGLGSDEVDDLLGRPDLVRREPPAEIRQYSAESCVFDVFLYDEAGRYSVTYLEARDLEARRIDARPCLNRLLRARLAGDSG